MLVAGLGSRGFRCSHLCRLAGLLCCRSRFAFRLAGSGRSRLIGVALSFRDQLAEYEATLAVDGLDTIPVSVDHSAGDNYP